jgi:hypothetical protein
LEIDFEMVAGEMESHGVIEPVSGMKREAAIELDIVTASFPGMGDDP